MSSTVSEYLMKAVIIALVILSIVLHEMGHGIAAYAMGDNTAKDAGRLSLNPIRHLDPFGSFLLPLLLVLSGGPIIGYAKPVPYNPNRLRNRRVGEVVVGLAGPAVNLILALIGALLAAMAQQMYPGSPDVWYWVWQISAQLVIVNMCLMFFNLLPVPPLDGSSIIAPFLSDKALARYYQIQHYAMPVFLIVVLIVPRVLNVDPIGIYIDATAVNLAYALLGI